MGFGHEVWSNILYSVDQTKFQLAAKMVFPKGFKSKNSESANGEFTRLKGTSGAWRWVARSCFGSFGCGSKSPEFQTGLAWEVETTKTFLFFKFN